MDGTRMLVHRVRDLKLVDLNECILLDRVERKVLCETMRPQRGI